MFVRKAPKWAGWSTVLFGGLATFVLYDILPLPQAARILSPVLGERVYHYMITNKFAVTNLLGIPVTSLFFIFTRFFYKRTPSRQYERQVQRFFNRMETPVDFDKEVGRDNTQAQARILGKVMCVYGALIGLILLVPNSAGGRLAVAVCAGMMLSIGGGLLLYARRIGQMEIPSGPSTGVGRGAPSPVEGTNTVA
jgi:hypothetical protein